MDAAILHARCPWNKGTLAAKNKAACAVLGYRTNEELDRAVASIRAKERRRHLLPSRKNRFGPRGLCRSAPNPDIVRNRQNAGDQRGR